MTEAEKFMEWIAINYEKQLHKLSAFTVVQQGMDWDEDIYSDTILKVYEKIERDGLKDASPQGLDNYLFMAYRTNLVRETQYVRNAKRDRNVDAEEAYEGWANDNMLSAYEKLLQDLYRDFSTIYILKLVEENFDAESYYLFRLKFLENLTYKKLAEKTHIKGARQKVVNVLKWCRENVTKVEIKKALWDEYGDVLEYSPELNF